MIEHCHLLCMAGCLSFVEGGNISPENVRKWTEKLSNVLLSSTARHGFNNYLKSRELENGQTLLKFWGMCDKFLIKAEERNHHTEGWRQKNLELEACSSKTEADGRRNHNTEIILKEAQQIVQFAEDEINFDAEMKTLNSAIKSGNIGKIVTAISEAKEIAAERLEEEGYQEFCQYLLKKEGLLRDGN